MDEMERQRCYKVLEKLTPEELNDAKTIVQKSIEIGDLLSEITIEIVKNNGYNEKVLVMATAYALKLMIMVVEDRGGLGDETPKSLVENTLVPFIIGE